MEEELCGGNNNWDLGAVVRLGCCRRRISPASSASADPFASFLLPPVMEVAAEKEMAVDVDGWSFRDLAAGGGDGAGLGRDADELRKAFCAAFPSSSPPPLTEQPKEQQQQKPVVVPENLPVQTSVPASAPARSPAAAVRQVAGGVPRSKRRKNQQKKVVRHVPADGVSADVWAWRKYGQKPIKGSPYPRGYYRCSSSKGCPARKQVERSRADPNTFILTYTGEHNHSAPTHRNSLAGTTRNKLSPSSTSSSASPAAQQQPQPPPPSVVVAGTAEAAAAGLSPTTPLRTPSMEEDEEEDVDDELLVEDMEMAGEDELLFLNGGDGDTTAVSSLFDIDEPTFLPSPWTEQAAAPAAAGS